MKRFLFVLLLAGCDDRVRVSQVCDPAIEERVFAECMVSKYRNGQLYTYSYWIAS